MKKCKAKDYTNYNKRLGLFQYGYLHRLFDLLFKISEVYHIRDDSLVYWESDTGNQAEIKDTMYLNINQRVKLHKQLLKKLWKQRSKTSRQLKLFYHFSCF